MRKASKMLHLAAGGALSLILPRLGLAAPAYRIVQIAPNGPTDNSGIGANVSESGNYAVGATYNYTTGHVGSSSYLNYTKTVAYNVGTGVGVVQSQTGIVSGSTAQPYGQPVAIGNNGVSFGVSAPLHAFLPGSVPTAWVNGSGYTLAYPGGGTAAKVYGANDLNQAVGVGGAGVSLNQAALFNFNPSNGTSTSFVLTQLTPEGKTLNTAYGINDNGLVVGQANQNNLGAGYLPFTLDLSADTPTVNIIPGSTPPPGSPFSAYNGGQAFAVSSNGLVVGTETFNQGSGSAFLYNTSNTSTIGIPLPPGASGPGNGPKGVNSSGEVVGSASGAFSLPYLYDGTNTYLVGDLLVNNPAGYWHLSDNTSSSAMGISDNGIIAGRAVVGASGILDGYIAIPVTTTLTFGNAPGTGGDGITWDTSQLNFNNGSAAVAFSSANQDYVTFTDANSGQYNVSISGTVTPSSVVFNNSLGNYNVGGAGSIGGTGGILKLGTGMLTLNEANTFIGGVNVSAGSLVATVAGAIPAGSNLDIAPSASVLINSTPATTVQLSQIIINGTLNLSSNSLSLQNGTVGSTGVILAGSNPITVTGPGTTTFSNTANNSFGAANVTAGSLVLSGPGAWSAGANLNISAGASVVVSTSTPALLLRISVFNDGGLLNLNNNDLVIAAGSSPQNNLTAINALVASGYNKGRWTGTVGISSSYDSTITSHLTAVGVIQNNQSGSALFNTNTPFEGYVPGAGDILVKNTYYGDANLDGQVNSADYTLVDTGFLNKLTGWFNGDFNYDGVVNGSDYTLLDNAFNTQGVAISSEIAVATAQIAGTSSVPEPAGLSLIAGAVALLGRSFRKRNSPRIGG